MRSLRVITPAKINLYLGVLSSRQDGYHQIETLFQAIDLSDELIIREKVGESTIEVPGHPALETEDNLVIRALRWIENEVKEKIRVSLSLTKNIPESAGLGGGSSDAAATLLGIRELFDLNLGDDELNRGALTLGADVPFFLTGGTAVGEGIGERLTPVTMPVNYSVLLVNPGFPVSTAAVFRKFSKGLTGRPAKGKLWNLLGEKSELEELLHNDLQPVCEGLYPEISEICNSLEDLGIRRAMMTGSGPTVFGTVEPYQGTKLRERIPKKWKTFLTRPLQRGVIID